MRAPRPHRNRRSRADPRRSRGRRRLCRATGAAGRGRGGGHRLRAQSRLSSRAWGHAHHVRGRPRSTARGSWRPTASTPSSTLLAASSLDGNDVLMRPGARVVSVAAYKAAAALGGSVVWVRPDADGLSELAEMIDAGKLSGGGRQGVPAGGGRRRPTGSSRPATCAARWSSRRSNVTSSPSPRGAYSLVVFVYRALCSGD